MKDIKIICDFRENFPNFSNTKEIFNDHPNRKSIDEICDILNTCGYSCEVFGGVNQLIEAYINQLDLTQYLIINMSDGLTQSYSRIQVPMLCEMLNANYSGSSVFAVALMNNKYYSKLAVNELNINTPKGIIINRRLNNNFTIYNLDLPDFPLIVKPNTEGSSIGISQLSVCHDIRQLEIALNKTERFAEVIIEEYIRKRQILRLG